MILHYRKTGGLHFLRIWKLRISWCISRKPIEPNVRQRILWGTIPSPEYASRLVERAMRRDF